MPQASVGFDARMWAHPGIGRYVRELSRAMALRAPGRVTFLGPPRLREFLPPATPFRRADSPIYSVSEQLSVPVIAAPFDVLHVPHFNAPLFYSGKLVVTVHDLIYLRDAKASKRRFGKLYAETLFGHIAKKAAAVIAVSEATKADLLDRFPALKSRVRVIHEAASPSFRRIDDPAALEAARRRLGLTRPFVLHVGTLKPHKNLPFLVQAMDKARERGAAQDLVVAGRPDDKAILAELQSRSFTRYLGEVADEELLWLYNLADAFVLPSLVEGFGLPVLEAMACGTPVLVSDRTSLPEVAGDAGRLFDPLQVDALAELLYNVLQNGELRRSMSQKGLERARRFSWEKTADETLRLYESLSG